MCDFEKGFKLCSCKLEIPKIQKNKKSKKYKDIPVQKSDYRWVLSRLAGIRDETNDEFLIEGEYSMPSKDIGKGLDDEWIMLNLNLENCFDFEYCPMEGDSLSFFSNANFEYLSFIFKNGNWIIAHYDSFNMILKKIDEGIVESKDKNLPHKLTETK